MNCLEIFSGAGGLAKGLELSGFKHAAFVEFNAHACTSLRKNFDPKKVFETDIRDFDFSKLSGIDVVAGGPPCQPFSLGGKHKANQDRRDMFPVAISAIEILNPKAFIFENVKGLLRESFSEYFEYIILRLIFPDAHQKLKSDWRSHYQNLKKLDFDSYKGAKYRVLYNLVDAADYGVSQNRERVVIVGLRADLDANWKFPEKTHSEDRLLWEKFVTGEYWDRHKVAMKDREECPALTKGRVSGLACSFFPPENQAWRTVRDALTGIPDAKTKHELVGHDYRGGAKTYTGHTGSDIDWPAKTIKAGDHGVPGGENMVRYRDGSVRYFTVYEAKLIQAFPENYVINGAWGEALRQIGNAVPVTLGQVIGNELHRILSKKAVPKRKTNADKKDLVLPK